MKSLRERIADQLCWSLEQCNSFSLQTVRELLPVGKLRSEVDDAIRSGSYITDNQPKPRKRRFR